MIYLLDHLEKLPGFKAVADTGSFHKAAALIRIAQPSLSASIAKLESAVGRKLFYRNHKGVTLTQEGSMLLQFANSLVVDTQNVALRLLNPHESLVGNLRIGLYESLAIYYWPEFIKTFQKKYPSIQLSLNTGRSHVLEEKLARKDLDVIISIEAKNHKNIFTKVLHTDTFSYYASPLVAKRFAEAAKAKNSEAKSKIPIILFSDAIGKNAHLLESQLLEEGFEIENLFEVDSFEIAKELAISDIGIAILPEKVAEKYCKNKSLKQVRPEIGLSSSFSEHRICISYARDQSSNPLLNVLDSALCEYSKKYQ